MNKTNEMSSLPLSLYPIDGITLELQLMNLIRKILLVNSVGSGTFMMACINARKLEAGISFVDDNA